MRRNLGDRILEKAGEGARWERDGVIESFSWDCHVILKSEISFNYGVGSHKSDPFLSILIPLDRGSQISITQKRTRSHTKQTTRICPFSTIFLPYPHFLISGRMMAIRSPVELQSTQHSKRPPQSSQLPQTREMKIFFQSDDKIPLRSQDHLHSPKTIPFSRILGWQKRCPLD